jgi:opacity protein-like surface antigen
MMNRLIVTLLFSFVTCASAQLFEIGAHGGVSRLNGKEIGALSDGVSSFPVELDDGWRFGFRMTINNLNRFGHEGFYAYNRSKLLIGGVDNGGMAIHQGGYNFLIYATREGSVVRPFITGGGHFSNFVPPGTSATQGGGDTNFGYNFGAGIKARVKPNWGFRVDFRHYTTGKPFDLPQASGSIRQIEVSVGFMYMM